MQKKKGSCRPLLALMFLALFGCSPQVRAGLDMGGIRQVAEQGDADAQFDLGDIYATGNRTAKDDIEAYAWFDLAAAQGEANAAKRKEMVAIRLSPEQRLQAQALALELQGKISQHGQQTASLRYWSTPTKPTVANKAELRSWLQSIKPAAGGQLDQNKTGL